MDLALRLVDGRPDIVVDDDDLLIEEGIETSEYLSLFLDGRVTDEELPSEETSKRGFWGDKLGDGTPTGSKLWLLKREKTSEQVRLDTEQFAAEALQHLIDDGFVESIEIDSSYDEEKNLSLKINNKTFLVR